MMPIRIIAMAKARSRLTDRRRLAVRAPSCVPASIPITNGTAYSNFTCPSRMCVETPEIEVKIIVSIDVATAICIGKPT